MGWRERETRVRHRGRRLAAGLVAAATLGLAASDAQAAASAPVVQVTTTDGVAVVAASDDIDAPPAVVWRMVVDPDSAVRMVANTKSCRVLQRDPAGRWDVREQVSKGGILPGVRVVIRSDYSPPYLVRFHRVDGDLKVLEGEWRLTPLDGGTRTHLAYASRLVSPFPAPAVIVRTVLRKDMPQTLANVRDASERAAAAPP